MELSGIQHYEIIAVAVLVRSDKINAAVGEIIVGRAFCLYRYILQLLPEISVIDSEEAVYLFAVKQGFLPCGNNLCVITVILQHIKKIRSALVARVGVHLGVGYKSRRIKRQIASGEYLVFGIGRQPSEGRRYHVEGLTYFRKTVEIAGELFAERKFTRLVNIPEGFGKHHNYIYIAPIAGKRIVSFICGGSEYAVKLVGIVIVRLVYAAFGRLSVHSGYNAVALVILKAGSRIIRGTLIVFEKHVECEVRKGLYRKREKQKHGERRSSDVYPALQIFKTEPHKPRKQAEHGYNNAVFNKLQRHFGNNLAHGGFGNNIADSVAEGLEKVKIRQVDRIVCH